VPSARLAVALLIPGPVATEVDGLRRALADGARARVAPHLTLVPPVNVNLERIDEALAVVRAAASAAPPLELVLGPAATFLPATPVAYLGVGGPAVSQLRALREAVMRPPLARAVDYDFVPHVTVASELADDRLAAAVAALADYRVTVRVDRVHVLREEPGRRWVPFAEAVLAAPAVVARGGLELELAVASAADGPVREALGAAPTLAVTARRGGVPVGLVEALVPAVSPAAVLVHLSVAEEHRGTGVGRHLLAAAVSEAAAAGCRQMSAVVAAGGDLHRFLAHLGFAEESAPARGWLGPGVDAVCLVRRL